ncbi:cytochrome b/b6 domain-containing protein [Anaerosporobacter sp.]|uniref:cytochrome b/b6 domain-containing protein n=1 Tax=Anaerosporobacter sp. TaxID=1872529 RepID=UPI00286F74D4|nr:cytochrome b/b6 domain-containing protein [Anaerosporobacter sp.]
MKPKLMLKMFLNLLMTIIFVALICMKATGIVFHEIAGLLFAGVIIGHLLLNGSWIKTVTKSFWRGKANQRSTIMYILNMTLFVCMFIILITGIAMSQVVFKMNPTNLELLVMSHKITSYLCLGFLVIHIAFHQKYFVSFIKKLSMSERSKKVGSVVTVTCAVAFITFILYQQIVIYAFPDTAENVAQIASAQATITPKKEEEITIDAVQEDTVSEQMSLSDYLSKLYCSGCHKHCSLVAPRCNRSSSQISEATAQYEEVYGGTQ